MKVLENLENFDVPAGCNLTAKEEDDLANALSKMVHDLIPIRNSKLKTRKYLTSKISSDPSTAIIVLTGGIALERIRSCPFDDDVDAILFKNKQLLLYSLLSLLNIDRYSFGYAYNVIANIYSESGITLEPSIDSIPDALIRFHLQFDIERIREEIDAMSSYTDAFAYLKKIQYEFSLFNEWDRVDYQEFGRPFDDNLKDLIQYEDEERHIYNDKKPAKIPMSGDYVKTTVSQDVEQNTDTISEDSDDSAPYEIVRTDIYYNPEILEIGKWTPADLDLTHKYGLRQSSYDGLFKRRVQQLMDNTYTHCGGEEFSLNINTFDDAVCMIQALMEDYISRIRLLESDGNNLTSCIIQWVHNTVQCLNQVYFRHKEYKPQVVDSDTGIPVCVILSTYETYRELSSETYHYSMNSLQYESVYQDKMLLLPHILHYNFWGEVYSNDVERLRGRILVSEDDRAKIFPEANVVFFQKAILKYCNTFETRSKNTAENPFSDLEEIFETDRKQISDKLRDLFADYIKRVCEVAPNTIVTDYCIRNWLLETMYIVDDLYGYHESKSINLLAKYSPETKYRHRFYLDICLPTLVDMFINYCRDYDALPNKDVLIMKINKTGTLDKIITKETASHKDSADFFISTPNIPPLHPEMKDEETSTEVSAAQEEQISNLHYSSLLNRAQQTALNNALHKYFSSSHGMRAFVYIRAAILLDYFSIEPDFKTLEKEFCTIKGKESNYSAYMGVNGKFVINITNKSQALIDQAMNELKAIVSKCEVQP